MRSNKRTNGFSLLEVLVAAALFSVWLPGSLYALQTSLAALIEVQMRAELMEQMMTLKAQITKQWRQGTLSIQHDDIDWQLTIIDDQQAILELSAGDYQLQFVLSR